MRYVQTALKHGSITGAAEAKIVTPSAIAAASDQAEAAFGMALATRARARASFRPPWAAMSDGVSMIYSNATMDYSRAFPIFNRTSQAI